MHSKWFRNFLTLCDEADICIFASDMVSAGLTGWFLEQLNSWKKEQRRLLLNHTDYIATMRFSQLASEAEAIAARAAEEHRVRAAEARAAADHAEAALRAPCEDGDHVDLVADRWPARFEHVPRAAE